MENVIPERSIPEECDVFHLSDNKTILLTKMLCKDYNKFFPEKVTTEPTAVKSSSKRGLDVAHCWSKLFLAELRAPEARARSPIDKRFW